ncbi:helix-turn-helix domain-containing protein [Polynucleobacter paneuropaeus]|uniref:hypothetical protein n=1 Tax=Polynucleobacter paneuropaeus TaxID=2527775 RepID=UPI00384B2DC5
MIKEIQKLKVFDIAHFLDGEEVLTEYLLQVTQNGDTDELIWVLCHITRTESSLQISPP